MEDFSFIILKRFFTFINLLPIIENMTILCEFTIICSCNEIKKLLDKSMYPSEGKPEKANLCILDMKLFVKLSDLNHPYFQNNLFLTGV